jgi:hypothetical protein
MIPAFARNLILLGSIELQEATMADTKLFSLTKEDIAKYRAEHPELVEKMKPKKITGNTRNAALREQVMLHLGHTNFKVTKATGPEPVSKAQAEALKRAAFSAAKTPITYMHQSAINFAIEQQCCSCNKVIRVIAVNGCTELGKFAHCAECQEIYPEAREDALPLAYRQF